MQAMLQGTGKNKGNRGAKAKGLCDGKIKATDIIERQHKNISKRTPNEPTKTFRLTELHQQPSCLIRFGITKCPYCGKLTPVDWQVCNSCSTWNNEITNSLAKRKQTQDKNENKTAETVGNIV